MLSGDMLHIDDKVSPSWHRLKHQAPKNFALKESIDTIVKKRFKVCFERRL